MSTPVRQIRAGRWRVGACSQTPSASMCCRQRGRPRADPSDPRESSVRASSARAVWSSRSTLAAPRRARTDSASAAPGRRVHTSTCCASRRATTRTRAVARSSPVTRASEASTNHRSRAPARPPCHCDALFAGRRLGDAHASIVARRQPARTRSRLKHVGTTPRKAPTSSRRQRGRALRPLLSPTRTRALERSSAEQSIPPTKQWRTPQCTGVASPPRS